MLNSPQSSSIGSMINSQLFFVDGIHLSSDQVISNYEEREPNYFNVTISAFLKFSAYDLESLLSYETFDQFHKELTTHIIKDENNRRTDCNNFGLIPDVTADKIGLSNFINNMFSQQDITHYLDIKMPYQQQRFFCMKDMIQYCSFDCGHVFKIAQVSPNIAAEQVSNVFFGGQATITLNSLAGREDKTIKVQDELRQLRTEIEASKNKDEPPRPIGLIQKIISTMRNISQIHPYIDGNARLTYCYSNILFHKLNLKPFHLPSQSAFDCQSDEALLSVVTEGQVAFTTMFGTFSKLQEDLTTNLQTEPTTSIKIKHT